METKWSKYDVNERMIENLMASKRKSFNWCRQCRNSQYVRVEDARNLELTVAERERGTKVCLYCKRLRKYMSADNRVGICRQQVRHKVEDAVVNDRPTGY